jgi:hypothetical protein
LRAIPVRCSSTRLSMATSNCTSFLADVSDERF